MKTRLEFIGVICAECGKETDYRTDWLVSADVISWLGYTKVFRCMSGCKMDYILLFDHNRRFVSVVSESWIDNFLQSAGSRRPEFRDVDEIPF